MEFLHNLVNWTIGLSESPYGVLGLFGIAFAESSFFPVPPDLLQIALSVGSPKNSFFYAGIALVGSVTGAMLGYGIGYWGGRPLVQKILSQSRMDLIEKTYQKYDAWAIGIAGFTPVPYKVFAISGGAFRIHFWRFVLVSILARGGRFFMVATALFFFGDKVKDVILHHVNLFGIIIIVLIVIGFALVAFSGPRSKPKPT